MKETRLTRIVGWLFPGWKLKRLRAEITRREAARTGWQAEEQPRRDYERRVW